MVTRILPCNDAGRAAALEILRSDGVIAYPTDTVYGIGGNALSQNAVLQVFEAKQRPPTVPLPVLIADVADLVHVAAWIPPLVQPLAERFWAGALTIIVPAAEHLPPALLGGQTTVAVRVPDHAWLRDLIRQFGSPIAGTSANLHGQPSSTSAHVVFEQLNNHVPLILDGGASGADVPSTIIDVSGDEPRIVRHGAIAAEVVLSAIKRTKSIEHRT